MPVPEHLKNAPTFTRTAIPYYTVHDSYTERWAANGNQVTVQCLVAWEDAGDWLRDMVGWTEWDGVSGVLDRRVPEPCHVRDGLWCDEIHLVKMGVNKGTTELCDPFLENYPKADWLRYQVTFRRPPYYIRTISTLVDDFGAKEQHRYVKHAKNYNPRERKIPSYGFEYNDAPGGGGTWHPIDETGFIPDFQIVNTATWCQVPIEATPWTAIHDALLCVNDDDFDTGDGWTYPAGTLLFKGPATPFEWYQGADGAFYYDLAYRFDYQHGGWNYTLLRTRDGDDKREYGPVRARGGAALPPYPSYDFQELFRAGGG